MKKPNKNVKPIIDIYNPEIYPFKLVVACNTTVEELNKQYVYSDGTDLEEIDGTIYTVPVLNRKTREHCILVHKAYWENRKDRNIEIIEDCSHESTHVALDVFKRIGEEVSLNCQEYTCYLIQWIAKNIYTTLNKCKNGKRRSN